MAETKIEWADRVWNPIAGCSIVSPGCTNCYAMRMAARLERMGLAKYAGLTQPSKAGPVWTGKIAVDEKAMLAPLSWKKPARVFVNSMSDLFHEGVPDEVIDRVFAVMALCPHLTFMVLTKRADRMRAYLAGLAGEWATRLAVAAQGMRPLKPRPDQQGRLLMRNYGPLPLPNVWLGVSVERQDEANARIPDLLATPAAIRFISAEPLLGPIDLRQYLPRLDLVIVGGESGPRARPMHPDWVRDMRDPCAEAGVAFFVKQWGEWAPDNGPDADGRDPIVEGRARCATWDGRRWTEWESGHRPPTDAGIGAWVYRVGKKAAGRLLDGVQHDGIPGHD